jgi:hypothetical protein
MNIIGNYSLQVKDTGVILNLLMSCFQFLPKFLNLTLDYRMKFCNQENIYITDFIYNFLSFCV